MIYFMDYAFYFTTIFLKNQVLYLYKLRYACKITYLKLEKASYIYRLAF